MTTRDFVTADYVVADLALARRGTPPDRSRRARDAGAHGDSRRVRGDAAARGRAHRGFAPHDGADGRAHRDARRPRRRGPLGVVQRLLDPGRGGGGGRARRGARSTPLRACRSSRSRARASRSTGTTRTGSSRGRATTAPPSSSTTAATPRLLVHEGVRAEAAGAVPAPLEPEDPGYHRETEAMRAVLRRSLAADPTRFTRMAAGNRRRERGDDDGGSPPRAPPRAGRASLPRDQRQRLRYQVEVRQPLRHPPLAPRRAQPRHRRARSAARSRSSRDTGTWARARAEALRGPGRAGDRHRGGPHLRDAGGDGRVPGGAHRGRRRPGGLLHHDRRATPRHHLGASTWRR